MLNVALVHMESTRFRNVTPEVMPFFCNMRRWSGSLYAKRAYSCVPRTSKAVVSVNCGAYPWLTEEIVEADPGGLPARGLADILDERGYASALFQSSSEHFEDFAGLVKNFGYREYYPLEELETEGYQLIERDIYQSCEDEVMLGPSEEWLKGRKQAGEPFVVSYLTDVAHHEYEPPARYGLEYFHKDPRMNRYLNCLRYQDIFLTKLVGGYQRLGLFDETIFVFYGDHGEGFGEHEGREGHSDVLYEEGVKVPLLIRFPGRGALYRGHLEVGRLANLTDVTPTVLDFLGLPETEDCEGRSLLRGGPNRTLYFAAFHDAPRGGAASLTGREKFFLDYDGMDEGLFDLKSDPFEERNLAMAEDPPELTKRREALLEWKEAHVFDPA